MDKVLIGGKEYKILPTYGHFRKLLKKHDLSNAEQWTLDESNQFAVDSIWVFLKRKFIFKPFIFKFRMSNSVTMKELADFQKIAPRTSEICHGGIPPYGHKNGYLRGSLLQTCSLSSLRFCTIAHLS